MRRHAPNVKRLGFSPLNMTEARLLYVSWDIKYSIGSAIEIINLCQTFLSLLSAEKNNDGIVMRI